MLRLSDELQPYFEQKMPLLRIHSVSSEICGCGNLDCKSQGKHPAEPKGVHSAKAETSAKRFERFNVGVACGEGFVVLDIDPRNGGDASLSALIAKHGELPSTWKVATGGGGTHYYFRIDGTQKTGKNLTGIELMGKGNYVICPGSIHRSGHSYEWEVHPSECEMAPLPEWVKIACCGIPVERTTGQDVNLDSVYDEQDLRDALEFLDPNMAEPKWFEVGACIHSAGFPIEIWDEWSKQSNRYNSEVLKEKWSRYDANKPGRKTIGSLFWEAKQAGWVPREIEKWDFQKLASEQAQKYAQAEQYGWKPEPIKRIEFIDSEEPVIKPEPQKQIEIEMAPGLCGEIAEYILKNAIIKHPRFAIATALSIITTIAQGRYRSSNEGGMLGSYNFLVTSSGGGKGDYTAAFFRIVRLIDEDFFIGEAASGQALRRALHECPSKTLVLDEGLKALESLIDSKNENAKRLHIDFLSAWAGGRLNPIETKDALGSSPAIDEPRLSIIGGGTKDGLSSLLQFGSQLATDGLLSRTNFIIGPLQKPKSWIKQKAQKFPDHILAVLKKVAASTKTTETSGKKEGQAIVRKTNFGSTIQVEWNEETSSTWDAFADRCFCFATDKTSAAWIRTAEKALRDASVLAVIADPIKPTLSLNELDWAIRWNEMISNEFQKLCDENLGKGMEAIARDKIVQIIAKQGGRCSRNRIAKYWKQWERLDERVRSAAIEGLERDGIILVGESGAKRNRGHVMLTLLTSCQ
jgi:hypothetical protein